MDRRAFGTMARQVTFLRKGAYKKSHSCAVIFPAGVMFWCLAWSGSLQVGVKQGKVVRNFKCNIHSAPHDSSFDAVHAAINKIEYV
jgi:hypothetical protein